MPRKAFLLGRNTGSLRHCLTYDQAGRLEACDVQLMQDCLTQHEYAVALPRADADVGQIQTQLTHFLADCAQVDTVIVYFSGHSKVLRGRLNLVIADPCTDIRNLYSANGLIEQLENCPAGSKLLILDCCDAGQSVFHWAPAVGDFFRVLTATDRSNRSKELDELQAGVFTYHLCRAFNDPSLRFSGKQGVLDDDRVIRINTLYEWLKREVAASGQQHGRPFPIPELYGPASQNVALTGNLKLSGSHPAAMTETSASSNIAGSRPIANQYIHSQPSFKPMPPSHEDQPIRLLHLSDIHFTAGKAWDADPVLRALAKYIATEVKIGLVPDLVVFTGDLAYGGKAEEYQLAQAWLEQQLWPALPSGFKRDRLLVVPGNHDVDRPQVTRGAQSIQNDLLRDKNQNGITEILNGGDDRDIMLKRHTAYLRFVGEWLGQSQSLPWWQQRIDIRGTRLHVAGLDSAWMACSDEDRNRLLLGRYQINETICRDADEVDWRLVLLHHPWDYFAEFDSHESRATIHQHCDLLLRGHLHHPLTERVVPPDPSRGCLELAAGCVYENSDYPNAFQWIELHALTRQVKVKYRIWAHGSWTTHRNQPGCLNSEAVFDLTVKGANPPEPYGQLPSAEKSGFQPTRRGESSILPKAITAITELFEGVPALCAALAGESGVEARQPKVLTERLCAPDGDIRANIRTLKRALSDAAKSLRREGEDIATLKQRARDVLGWLVLTTVMDGYEREDADLVRDWFDGIVFEIPLGRNPCIEVLTARWRGDKAEFDTAKERYAYGADDITPNAQQELGFEDPNKVETGHAVGYVQRLAYQRIFGIQAPSELSLTQRQDLKARLEDEFEEKNRRLRLVIDRSNPNDVFGSRAVLEAIHKELSQLYLIFVHSDKDPHDGIFAVPPSKLASAIYGFLEEIENLA